MYCRKCYAKLDEVTESSQCPWCGRIFDRTLPASYLARPFPSVRKIIVQGVATIIIGFLAAGVVAMFQLSYASGH
jgi:hypothetical protein